MVEMWKALCEKYPIISIEDGLAEESPELQTKLCLLEINATYRHRIELNQLNNQASVSFFLISERKVVRNTI